MEQRKLLENFRNSTNDGFKLMATLKQKKFKMAAFYLNVERGIFGVITRKCSFQDT